MRCYNLSLTAMWPCCNSFVFVVVGSVCDGGTAWWRGRVRWWGQESHSMCEVVQLLGVPHFGAAGTLEVRECASA